MLKVKHVFTGETRKNKQGKDFPVHYFALVVEFDNGHKGLIPIKPMFIDDYKKLDLIAEKDFKKVVKGN